MIGDDLKIGIKFDKQPFSLTFCDSGTQSLNEFAFFASFNSATLCAPVNLLPLDAQ